MASGHVAAQCRPAQVPWPPLHTIVGGTKQAAAAPGAGRPARGQQRVLVIDMMHVAVAAVRNWRQQLLSAHAKVAAV